MFKTRLLSGILLVIIALVTVITGGNLLFAVLLLISLIGMTELYKVFHIEKKAPGIVGYIFAILYYGLLYFKPLLPGESLNWFVMLFMAFLICQMAVLVFAYPKYNTQQIFAIFLHYQWQFWVLAVWVGMFQGGVQALSRSYFTKIIPANQSGEFFGLVDICGKDASFMGTTIVSLISQLTGNINIGVGMIAVLFVIGIILFRRAAALE